MFENHVRGAGERTWLRPGILNSSIIAFCLLLGGRPDASFAQAAERPVGSAPARRDIRGTVRDAETGEALPHATVLLVGTKLGASTNTDGYFIIVNAPVGKQTLQARYIGYAVKNIEVGIEENTLSPLTIELKRVVYELEGITVEAQAQTLDASARVSQVVLAPAQLLSLPNLGEVDVFRSLQLLPGISGVSDGSAGLYVRGGTPDQNLVLFDGMTIYHVDHFFGMFSAFNADAIKDIRVYKGGYPAEFGGRISSVVELTGKTGDVNEMRYGLGVNLLSANGVFELPLSDKGSLLISARRSYTDFVKSSLYKKLFDFISGDQQTTNFISRAPSFGRSGGRQNFASVAERPDFYFYDLNTKLTLTPSEKDIVAISVYRGKDNLDQSQSLSGANFGFRPGGTGSFFSGESLSRQTREITDWGNTGISGKWSRRLHDRFYSSLIASYSKYFSTYDRSQGISGGSALEDSLSFFRGGGSASNEDNEVEDFTLRLDNEFHATDSHDLKLGLSLSNFSSQYFATLNDTTNLLSRQTKSRQSSVYLQDLWKVTRNLDFTAGVRGIYYDRTSSFYWEPRASLIWALSEAVRLKGAWGRYNQFVNQIANENVLEGSRDFWILADNELAPNFAEHYILGASWENDSYLFDVEGYYKNLENLVEYTRRVTPRDAGILQEVTRGFFQGGGFAKGLDFLLQKKAGRMTGWVGYSLGKVEYSFPELNRGESFPASHDRTHELNLVGKYRLGKWDLSATWIYATGKAYTAPESQYFIDLIDGSQLSYIHVSDKNSQRLPAYHRLDLGISRTFNARSIKYVAGFSIFNLYNRKNVWYRRYDLNTQPITVSDVTMLGFTPTIYLQLYSK
ncbi:MAG: TonB-dependent receptor [Candidatus Glassbacteria bacterium]